MSKLTIQNNHPPTCGHIIIDIDNQKKVTSLQELKNNKELKRPVWLRKIQKLIEKQNLKTTDAARKFLQGKNI